MQYGNGELLAMVVSSLPRHTTPLGERHLQQLTMTQLSSSKQRRSKWWVALRLQKHSECASDELHQDYKNTQSVKVMSGTKTNKHSECESDEWHKENAQRVQSEMRCVQAEPVNYKVSLKFIAVWTCMNRGNVMSLSHNFTGNYAVHVLVCATLWNDSRGIVEEVVVSSKHKWLTSVCSAICRFSTALLYTACHRWKNVLFRHTSLLLETTCWILCTATTAFQPCNDDVINAFRWCNVARRYWWAFVTLSLKQTSKKRWREG